MPEEFKKALRISWLVVSIAIYAMFGAALAVPESVWDALPPCEAKLAGGSCAACGMTSAFYRAACGDLLGASAANSASPYLLAILSMNSLASGVYFTLRIKNKYNNRLFKNIGE